MSKGNSLAADVTSVWARIESWLLKYAPTSHASIPPRLPRPRWKKRRAGSGITADTASRPSRPRLAGVDHQGKDCWEGAQWVAPFGNYSEATDTGLYLSATGLGRWSSYEGMFMGEPLYPSIAAYLEAVVRTLVEGPAERMGSSVPGIVYGCPIWQDPQFPQLNETAADWRPVH